jgi:hypothetical protein
VHAFTSCEKSSECNKTPRNPVHVAIEPDLNSEPHASVSSAPDGRCCSGQARHEEVHEWSVEGRAVRRDQQRAHDTHRRTSPRMKHVPPRCVAQRSGSPSRWISMMPRYPPARVDARYRFSSSHGINALERASQQSTFFLTNAHLFSKIFSRNREKHIALISVIRTTTTLGREPHWFCSRDH